LYIPNRHQIKPITRESNHFGFDLTAIGSQDLASPANRHMAANGLDGKPNHAPEFAFNDQRHHLRSP
jgi:hypothetical protein